MAYDSEFKSALIDALKGLATAHPVGEEWVSYTGNIPDGGVPYCGQEVSRETYSALWEWASAKGLVISESEWQSQSASANGNVPKYSSGDGSSTFRMPRITGYAKGAATQSEAGNYLNEGLPNISASVSAQWGFPVTGDNSQTGAIRFEGERKPLWLNDTPNSNYYSGLSFDASRSNPIYGNSQNVTPFTSFVLFGVYAFGSLLNVGELDALTLAQSLSKIQSNLDSKLPLKGGEMSGAIISNQGKGRPVICNSTGGQLWFFDADDATYKGGFILRARLPSGGYVDLRGDGEGTLVWNDNRVVTRINQALNASWASDISGAAGGSWTATNSGMVFFWCDNGTGWGGANMYINGVRIGYHYGKESGGTLCCPVKTGDVVNLQLDGSYTRQAVVFVPYN